MSLRLPSHVVLAICRFGTVGQMSGSEFKISVTKKQGFGSYLCTKPAIHSGWLEKQLLNSKMPWQGLPLKSRNKAGPVCMAVQLVFFHKARFFQNQVFELGVHIDLKTEHR